MATGIFEIEGADYWSDPLKHSARVLQKFVPRNRYGLFLDAPPAVDLRVAPRIPLLAVYAVKAREARLYDPWRNGHLVCVRLDDRSVEVEEVFDPPADEASIFADDDPPPAPAGNGASATVEQSDLRRLESLGRPGRFLLTALVLDRVSNRVSIDVSRSVAGYQDAEVPKFLDEARRNRPPPAPVRYARGEDAATFSEHPASPPPPEPPGIALACERVLLHEEGAQAIVRGTFRIALLPHERVPPQPEEADVDDGHGEPRPRAIVPVTLVVIGSATGKAEVISLRVPCFQGPDRYEWVTGYFAYDLFRHPSFAGKAQTNFIYAFCGDVMAGPTPMAVVTRSML